MENENEGMKSYDFDNETETLEQQIRANVAPVGAEPELEPELTPLADKNATILKSLDFKRVFNDLLLEVHDVESSLYKTQEDFTNVLLKRGIEINPQGMYKYLDLIMTRLMKIYTVKRMCMSLGMHSEYDKILDHELGLVYGPGANRSNFSHSGKVVGEAENGIFHQT